MKDETKEMAMHLAREAGREAPHIGHYIEAIRRSLHPVVRYGVPTTLAGGGAAYGIAQFVHHCANQIASSC